MGYTYGHVWTEERIKTAILDVVKILHLERMPSWNEIRGVYGNDKLTNKISKTYGYYGWAERLGLPMKQSTTQTGKVGEAYAAHVLTAQGFTVQRMSTGFPYDLYVAHSVKVDVKHANLYTSPTGAQWYSFGLGKKCPTCDVYMLIAERPDEKAVYIVPSAIGHTQICIGRDRSMYEQYRNRYDIIETLAYAMHVAMT